MVDALPPYKRIEGILADKGTDTRGNHYILVNNEIIGVDWLTFDLAYNRGGASHPRHPRQSGYQHRPPLALSGVTRAGFGNRSLMELGDHSVPC